MKKNVLIAVMALVIVGGAGFIAGDKLGNKPAEPETTVADTTVEAAVQESNASATTETVADVEPLTETVLVTEKVVATENRVEPKTEPRTEPAKVTEKATTAKVNKTEKTVETTKNSAEKITREKAKSIALNHAGLTEAEVRELEIELDYEKGVHVYEVSFESGKYDYDYDIDAYSGVIKFSEKDFDD